MPELTIANVIMADASVTPNITTLEKQPVHFRITAQTGDAMNSVRTSKTIPVPVENPAPMGVKAMGYNRPGGFEAFQALLGECGKATCEACSESQITADRGLAQLNASLRNKYVRGQTLPTKKSFLGTFFRAGDINDKAALAYCGEDWGVLAEDIECDRKKTRKRRRAWFGADGVHGEE